VKKHLLLFIAYSVLFPLVFYNGIFSVVAQTVSLTPHEVFVGDVAEIRYDFSSSLVLCPQGIPLELAGSKFTSNAWSTDTKVLSGDSFDILFARIVVNPKFTVSNSDKYILIIQLIPWVTEKLDIPPIDIVKAFELENNVEQASLIIDIPPVFISSIVEKTQKKVLQPSAGPLVIPGTTWIVYSLLLLVVLLGIVVIFFIARFKQFRNYLLIILHKIFLSKNYRLTLKSLTLLEKKSTTMDSRLFATGLSDTIRTYLQCRFNYNFKAVETSKLYRIFNTITGETASKSALTAIEDLQSVFMGLDYIKFSGVKDDTNKEMYSDLIKRVYESIAYLEKPEDDENEL